VSYEAIAGQYLRSNAHLTRYLRRLARDDTVAEDVAHQTWARLLDARNRGATLPEADGEFRALLFTMARNTFIDNYRRAHFETRTVRLKPEDLVRAGGAAPEHEQPAAAVASRDLGALLHEAIAALPPAQRRVIRLWQQGVALSDMTRRLAAPRETILSRKKYAFAKLRAHFIAAGFATGQALVE
jgi:RNA polymerase sigma factor (sigma-70 family)